MKGRNTGNWLIICLISASMANTAAAQVLVHTAAMGTVTAPVIGVHLPKSSGLHRPPIVRFPSVYVLERLGTGIQATSGFCPMSRESTAPYLWKADDLPFFCRIEYHLGKKSLVPFKFRLGSVEYVDWLEGKPGNAGYWPN